MSDYVLDVNRLASLWAAYLEDGGALTNRQVSDMVALVDMVREPDEEELPARKTVGCKICGDKRQINSPFCARCMESPRDLWKCDACGCDNAMVDGHLCTCQGCGKVTRL